MALSMARVWDAKWVWVWRVPVSFLVSGGFQTNSTVARHPFAPYLLGFSFPEAGSRQRPQMAQCSSLNAPK